MSGPLLRTERLELWQPRADDLAGLQALTQDAETWRFLGPKPPSEQDSTHRLLRSAGSWQLYGYGPFMVRCAGEAPIIGNCGMFHNWRGFGKGLDDVPEAGWILHPGTKRQGIAREAMDAVLAWFDAHHGPRRIACMIERGNLASERLAAALGFSAYDSHWLHDGADVVLYERLPA